MDGLEELGLGPEVVEALVAEGIEVPTVLQRHALPVIRRGNSVALRAGPGAGVLGAYGPALLDRLEPGAGRPRALVLAPSEDRAQHLAESLARLAITTAHRVAALGGPWALPGHADVLFAAPPRLAEAIRTAELKVDLVEAVVLDGASALLDTPLRESLDGILDALPDTDVQWIVVSEPISSDVRGFLEARVRRAVFLPPDARQDEAEASPVERGRLDVRTVAGGKEEALLPLVAEILEAGRSHVLLFFRSDDRAADIGDRLALHGFLGDAPGNPDVPVWLGRDPLEAREALEDASPEEGSFAVVSVDVPPDADTLDRRHGLPSGMGVVLVHPRELPHLRRIALEAGYVLSVSAYEPPRQGDDLAAFRDRIEAILRDEDLAPYLLVLEPLMERWDPAEVAAALAVHLRRVERGTADRPGTDREAEAPPDRDEKTRPPAWVKLFISIGERDGAGPGDLVGAITGEAGVRGDQIGRIEIRDTFARVEVEEGVAARVIRALNGVTMRGRSVRADYDRAEGRAGRGRGGGRRGPPRPRK